MDESEDNMSSEDVKSCDSPINVKTKPKKRSLVERELETSLTARVTSPVSYGEGMSTSRYGRARRLKTEIENSDKKLSVDIKSPISEKSPLKNQSPVYKMHASNSPLTTESPKNVPVEAFLENQIESIYQENISLSRFGTEEVSNSSPAKKFPKVYIRKDLIQTREAEETVMLIKNMFSPVKSTQKQNSHLNNILERSSERYSLSSGKSQNGYIDNSSVVKMLDFDSKKKKKENKESRSVPSKSELFELEAKCTYQVGDLAWARMGTYPFWPCIVTRDPTHGVFVKKKLFGRIERDVIHVTFFGDNGRRGWIVDTMLRKYLGQLEFETTREHFTPEDKKKDPRLYAAFFVSEKKQALWNTSVEEAEMLLREPKRLRIDIFNEMLEKSRGARTKQSKSGKISRTDSDVSLSESLYDTLFSEDDGKADNADRSRNQSRNKSLDVSDVVTACLDNMAAKTGITKIQRQSHMDRWLQKAKSKTPEKNQVPAKVEKEVKKSIKSKKKTPSKDVRVQNVYSLRKSTHESQNLLPFQNEHDYIKNTQYVTEDSEDTDCQNSAESTSGSNNVAKVVTRSNKSKRVQVANDDSRTTDSECLKDNTCDSMDSADNHIDDSNKSTDFVVKTNSSDSSNPPPDFQSESMEYQESELRSNNISDKGKKTSNVTKNHDLETVNQDQHIEKAAEIMKDDEIDKKSDMESFLNVETATVSIDKIDKTETSRNVNISIDEDSDSDYQLPYSPLSVDLNKDRTPIEELDNQILEDQHLDELNEADIQTDVSNMVEKDDSLSYDIIAEKCLNNNLNSSLEENKNVICNYNRRETAIRDNHNERNSNKESTIKETGLAEKHKLDNDIEIKRSLNTSSEKVILDSGLKKLPNTKNKELQNQAEARIETSLSGETSKDLSIESESHEINRNKLNHIYTNDTNNMHIDERNNKKKEDDSKNHVTKSKHDHKLSSEIINSSSLTKHEVLNGDISNKETEISNVQEYTFCNTLEHVKENGFYEIDGHVNKEFDVETASINSEDSMASTKSDNKRKLRSKDKIQENPSDNLEFVKYVELRQDAIMDENPELSQEEIVAYLHKTWLYEESLKNDTKKNDDLLHQNIVKGLNNEPIQTRKKNLSLNKSNKLSVLQRKKNSKVISEEHNKEIPMKETETFKKTEVSNESTACKSGLSTVDLKLDDIEENPSNSINSSIPHNKDNDTDTMSVSSCDSTIDVNSKISLNSKDIKERDMEVMPIDSADINLGQPTKATNLQNEVKNKVTQDKRATNYKDFDADSIDSEDSETPLIKCKLRALKSISKDKEIDVDRKVKTEADDVISINSEDSEVSTGRRKKKKAEKSLDDPEFVKYLELRQDALIDENPQLTQEEIVTYLYQTWLYEENSKSDLKKTEEIEQSSLVKGLNDNVQQPKKIRRNKIKTEKEILDDDVNPKEKPKRKSIKPYYNEEYSDIEEEIEYFEIFKTKNKQFKPKTEVEKSSEGDKMDIIVGNNLAPETSAKEENVEEYDEVELYFEALTKPKPNIFKGLVREKVCEICEKTGNLVKCKGCSSMFHVDCVKKETEVVDVHTPARGRKKKKKVGRKPKSLEDSETQEDGSDQNASIEEIIEMESHTVDADILEAQLTAKMKEIIQNTESQYDSYSSDDGLDWSDTVPGKCEIIDIKLKSRNSQIDYSDYKCNNCQKYDTPVCFVCKSAASKTDSLIRQKCHVAHCHKYYHLECLDHWPQTQFNGGEPSKNNKKINEYFEALTCPRHVCHTCVSDDPRGCKTRFSGDKLARCVRCPATYHSFTKCLPAGTQILTGSHIICPRHYQHRPGKIPCHVNTGWCFICALGGSLICCEYCPTSFHAECLNIKPPEGGYMCEDCETGRLPLYGEMVWVKLGHYRWWPGIILHPTEIPENILAVKHSPGEFVVRFFGQYDHYWVNRGRVFPFQEGDSGRISSQKSKIDAAFTTAMEHAQRACEILKTAQPNEEESLDIASSLLPPHYVKLKVNKPCGSLCGRRLEDPESSLTQCECNPLDEDPCGPYSQCLNRMLLTECGPTCRAADRCNNRAFEKRLYPKLVPYRTPSRGWGLKTLEDIRAGQFVIEYVGELIDEEEFRRRMRRKHEMRDENFYFLTLDKERMIDAGPKGNLARFMNHCCEPNCETQKWTVLGDVRVGLFALYDIPANSEVTFNYNLECAGIDKKRCMCGAKRCSGYIGAKPKQDDNQSKKIKIPSKRAYKKRKPTEESPSTKNKPKRPIGRPPKPRELTEIEKDLLIIKNATNGLSSDESSRSLSSDYDRNPKALKRKRVSFSTEEIILYNGAESPNIKKHKLDVDNPGVGD